MLDAHAGDLDVAAVRAFSFFFFARARAGIERALTGPHARAAPSETQVLALLPGHWSLSMLEAYLPRALRHTHHRFQQGRIVRNLYRSQMVQLKVELARLRAPAAVIQESRCEDLPQPGRRPVLLDVAWRSLTRPRPVRVLCVVLPAGQRLPRVPAPH